MQYKYTQLFKYMNEPYSLFNDGFIRLSQPIVLNDPFEASFCHKSLDELSNHFDDPLAYDSEYGEMSFSKYIETRMHHIGVICFSENKENLLMWAHYANNHKGIVAGIANISISSMFYNLFKPEIFINSIFGGDESYLFNGVPKPVSYRKGLRYQNDKFDYDYSNIYVEGADRTLYEVFMQKSDEWIYEQEHRVVLRLEQSDRVILPDIDEILNENIKEKIRTSSFTSFKKDGSCIINLLDVEDKDERIALAIELSKLSRNPEIIYLMKLSAQTINQCILGLKSSQTKQDIENKYAGSIGYLDIWKASKNNNYYSLEFKQI